MIPKFFIAVYTHEVKDYCLVSFFNALGSIAYKNKEIHIVDNTDSSSHLDKIQKVSREHNSLINNVVSYQPKETLFLRRVTNSVNTLRKSFLESDADYFFIIESDVIVPSNICELFNEAISLASPNWGIIGGLYYQTFHYFNTEGLIEVPHALSGCTIYKREVIEKYPFRWSFDNISAFPDAWICYDINKEGLYKIYNYTKIKCEHKHDSSGRRGMQLL